MIWFGISISQKFNKKRKHFPICQFCGRSGVQHNHLPHCKLQVNLARNGNQASRTLDPYLPAESSQCNSPLFNRVEGQVEVPAVPVNFRGSLQCYASNVLQNKTLTCPARQVMFWKESSHCNLPLFNEGWGKWKCQRGK